jgi:hypothetical protein
MPNRYLGAKADAMLHDIMDRQKYLDRSGAVEFLYDFYFDTLKEMGMKLLKEDEKQ